jgi:Cu(I)/Ag(I) efflux system membrane fusion protein
MKKYFALAILSVMLACTTASKDNAGDDTAAAQGAGADPMSIELADSADQNVYRSYISLKNALVATNFDEAKKSAALLKTDLEKREGCESTALVAGDIANATDITAQRKQFTAVSNDLIALFKHAELKEGEIYVQHCPMANGGEGGDWLASEKKVQNPYYGDEMMECGSVIEEIKPKK